jgi:hypothetical protein
MPTSIIVHLAKDGTRFDSEADALAHESLLEKIAVALAPLGSTPGDVADGNGWVQHSRDSFVAAKTALCALVAPAIEDGWPRAAAICRAAPIEVHPMGIVGRILSESRSPLGDAWNRFTRIDDKFREHQQPFYALHGPESRHVCVEDRS